MGKIITELPAQTPRQKSVAIKGHEMPECAGNPQLPCASAPTDFMIKGYDDKHRCNPCNGVHVALVMREAGASTPGATQPQFVAHKLDVRAKLGELSRRRRIASMLGKLEGGRVDPRTGHQIEGQIRGSRGLPKDAPNFAAIGDDDYRDMKDAMQRDAHGTREDGIGEDERRRRILAKYGQSNSGSSM